MAKQRLSILIVEDDIAVAELLRTLLNCVPGWNATVVHDATSARTTFHTTEFDALVLDVNLPDTTGTDLLAELTHEPAWRNQPVILTSANGFQPAIDEALRRTPNTRFIPKPFDVDDIVSALESLPAAPNARMTPVNAAESPARDRSSRSRAA
jgi:CheY-like chemotaxis protein